MYGGSSLQHIPPRVVCFCRDVALGSGRSVLLLRGGGLDLGGPLPVAPDHDHGEEGADDGGADEDEDDGDADGPDAGREEALEEVVVVDEGLGVRCQRCTAGGGLDAFGGRIGEGWLVRRDGRARTMRRVQMV